MPSVWAPGRSPTKLAWSIADLGVMTRPQSRPDNAARSCCRTQPKHYPKHRRQLHRRSSRSGSCYRIRTRRLSRFQKEIEV